jgi:hypothetical protein
VKQSDGDLEARLRRTLATIAETPLDETVPSAADPRRRLPFLAVAAAVAALLGMAALALVDRGDRVTMVADGGGGQPAEIGVYLLTRQESQTLFRAEQRLLLACMQTAGQPYAEVSPEPEGLEDDWNRLGRTDAQRAERIGYVLAEGMGGRHPVVDTLRTAEERDAWSRALTGEPYSSPGGPTGPSVPMVNPVTGEENGRQSAGGCFGEVQRELYGDQSRHISLSSWVTNEVRGAVERGAVEDERFRQAIGSWSSCMKDRGHDYDDPFGPVNEFNEGPKAGRPTSRELSVAQADVECKEVSGLVHVYRKLLAEHGREPVVQHGALLVEYRAIVDRALAKARVVLATPASTTTTCCDR